MRFSLANTISSLVKEVLILQYKNKMNGFTLVEMMVVIFIICILMGLGLNAYGKYYENAKVSSVKQELSAWMSDINQYIEDYGKPCFSTSVKNIASQGSYLAYIYSGDAEAEVSDIPDSNAHDFATGSFLGLFQKYVAESLTLESKDAAVYTDDTNHYVVLTTRVKKDPWNSKYYFYINTVTGVVIVLSPGPDGVHDITQYAAGGYGDDLVLVVNPK